MSTRPNKPAEEFIEKQDTNVQVVVAKIMSKVIIRKDEVVNITDKLLKHLFDDIFEIRDRKSGVRVFVLFNEEQNPAEMVVFHIIIKKQDKIPAKELDVLKKRVNHYKGEHYGNR